MKEEILNSNWSLDEKYWGLQILYYIQYIHDYKDIELTLPKIKELVDKLFNDNDYLWDTIQGELIEFLEEEEV